MGCGEIQCPVAGDACCNGVCRQDPCSAGYCGPGYRCLALPDCTLQCAPIPGYAADSLVGVGGGGAVVGCRAGGGGAGRGDAGLVGLALLGALALRRRRGASMTSKDPSHPRGADARTPREVH